MHTKRAAPGLSAVVVTVAGLGLGLGVALAGCTIKRTEIVIGIATDLPARGALDRVRLNMSRVDPAAGLIALNTCDKDTTGSACTNWDLKNLPDGLYDLPGSFGVYTEDGSEPRIQVDVIGELNGKDIVTRSSIVSLINQETLFMRMALVLKCEGGAATCPSGTTCIEGSCQGIERPAASLPLYLANMELQVECQGDSILIDTANKNQPLPVTGSCEADEACQEGTCYKVSAAAPMAVGFDQTCNGTTIVCANSTNRCGATGLESIQQTCRQPCTKNADCTSMSPHATGDPGVMPTFASCEKNVCTFACSPILAFASTNGCQAGQSCIAFNSTSAEASELYTECIKTPIGATKGDGQSCAAVSECLSGFTCSGSTSSSGFSCRAMCRPGMGMVNNPDCAGINTSYLCCPQQWGTTGSATDSTRFGACKPSC